MPKSLSMQAEYGADLTVLLVEAQRVDRDEMLSFALKRGWLAGDALWTKERVIDLPQRGLPGFVLLSHTGEVLLSGSPLRQHAAIEQAIESDLKAARRAPDGLGRSVRRAFDDYHAGKPGKALVALEALIERSGSAPEDVEEAGTLLKSLRSELDQRLAALEARAEAGHPVEALKGVTELRRGLRGAPALLQRAQALQQALKGPEGRKELASDKAFTKLADKILERGPDRTTVKRLEAFLAKHGARWVTQRAQRLLELCRRAV